MDGTYDGGLSPGRMLLVKAGDGGTNNELSEETTEGIGDG